MVTQATHYVFEWANVSLRRGESRLSKNTCKATVLEVELSPRRRELAWARVRLAWARPFCLSEKLDENVAGPDVFLDLKCWQYVCMSIIFKNMNWMTFMNGMVYELWFMSFNMMWVWCLYEMIHGIVMMSLVWVRHETWKCWYQCGMVMIWDGVPYSWFENNELVWFGWERGELWETCMWCICIYVCMHAKCVWLIKNDWSVSVRNFLESLGGTFRVALQWSGRNPMAPVSGCPWWCPIYMVW